jgi:hypothetical protein
MRSTFLWDGAYSSGVSRKEKEITNSAHSAARTTLSVVEGEWVVHTQMTKNEKALRLHFSPDILGVYAYLPIV